MDQKDYYNRLHRGEIHIRKDIMPFVADAFSREIMRFADVQDSDIVLDVGCGEGEYEKIYSDKFIVGVDISYEALKGNKGKYRIIADATKLPFRPGTFDKILCREVIEHLPTMDTVDKSLAEMNRVLKRKGVASISTPNANNLVFFFTNIVHGRRNMNPALHPTMLSEKMLKTLVARNGFDLRLRSYLLPLPVPRYEYMFPGIVLKYLYYIGYFFPSIAHGFVVKAVKK